MSAKSWIAWGTGCAATLCAPALASGVTWTSPRTVQASKTSFQHPFSVARGGDGTIAIVFRHRGDRPDRATVHVAVRTPSGRWRRTRTVSDPRYGAAQPRIAVDARGRVLVVWARPSSRSGSARGPFLVVARAATSSGRWGSIVAVGRSAHFFEVSPGVAFDAHGNAIVAWRGYRRVGRRIRDVVQASYRRVDGKFTRAVDISPTTTTFRVDPVVAMSPGGRAYVAWASGIERPHVDVAVRTRAARWLPARRVSDVPASEPKLTVGADGAAVVAWREADVDTEGNGVQSGGVGAAVETGPGKFGAPLHLADARTSGVLLASAQTGETILAWENSAADGLHYAIRSAGEAGFGSPQVASQVHAGALVVLDDGSTVAYWSDRGIKASLRPGGGGFGRAQQVSTGGLFPAAAPGGAVTWLEGDVLRFSEPAGR